MIVLATFALLAPTLPWPQFSGDSEDLVVQAVLQIRNGGPRWIPMLGDQPRFRKPPLPTWIAAAAVTPGVMRDLPSTDPSTREAAYRWLAWEVRWPSLAAGCAMMLAVAALAEMTAGPAHVVPSMLIFASSLMFLRFIRSATTDVYLTLFVLIANALIATALLRGKRWIGLVGAGTAIGLAFMCKGPVCLVQTIVPAFIFVMLNRQARRQVRTLLAPALAGLVMALAVGLPWYISVYHRYPTIAGIWVKEVDRQAGLQNYAPWYYYLILLPNFLPWLPVLLAGIWIAGSAQIQKRRLALPLLLLLVPIVIMSFFPDRRDRYLFPMTAPAAILAAHAVVRIARLGSITSAGARLVWFASWGMLILLAVGLPATCLLVLRGPHHEAVVSVQLAIITALVGSAVAGVAGRLQRYWRDSHTAGGALLMLLLNGFFLWTWSQSTLGLSEMKPVADRLHAAFPGGRVVYYDPPPDGKPVTLDLDIYLDRPVPVLAEFPPADGQTAAVCMLVKDGDPLPAFPGWRIFDDLRSRKHHWYLLTPAKKLSTN